MDKIDKHSYTTLTYYQELLKHIVYRFQFLNNTPEGKIIKNNLHLRIIDKLIKTKN